MARLKRELKYKCNYIGFKCDNEEGNIIKLKANLYTDGNLSEYVRYAAMHFEPTYDDLESEEIEKYLKHQEKTGKY